MGLFKQILYLNPVTGPTVIFYDIVTGTFQETIDEEVDEVVEIIGNYVDDLETVLTQIAGGIGEGLENLGEGVLEGLEYLGGEIGDLGSDIGNSLLGLIRYLGVAVIESMEDTYQYVAGKVGGKKVQITSSVTILGILMFTAFYIFARLPSGGDSE